MRAKITPSALLAVALSATAPLAADVLVTVEGAQITTRGPWEVKRGSVVFTSEAGTLSSLRLSEVDLTASEAATVAALAPKAVEPTVAAPKRQAVARITDADIPRGTPVAPVDSAATAAEESAPAVDPDDPIAQAIQLDSWRLGGFTGFDGSQIEGKIRNDGQGTIAQLSLEVEALDREGKVVGKGRAFLTSTALPPGASTSFRLPLREVYDVADLRVVPRGTMIQAFLEQSSDSDGNQGDEGDGAF